MSAVTTIHPGEREPMRTMICDRTEEEVEAAIVAILRERGQATSEEIREALHERFGWPADAEVVWPDHRWN